LFLTVLFCGDCTSNPTALCLHTLTIASYSTGTVCVHVAVTVRDFCVHHSPLWTVYCTLVNID
jgi:hypothetical protein